MLFTPSFSYLIKLIGVFTLFFYHTLASASPWLLPPQTLVLSGRYDYTAAHKEFLADEGKLQAYPLQGQYNANTYTLGARLGISKRFEIEVSLPFKIVSYQSDPIILVTSPEDSPSAFDFYQNNIINFTKSSTGLGDLNLLTRFSLSTYPIASSLEIAMTAPTGYGIPSGTFGERPATATELIENSQEYIRPENIKDDVTLGDGVFSFTPTIHAGFGSSFGLFVRGSAGFRFRNGGAGDQLISEGKAGYFISSWMLVYAGVYSEYTLISGRSIGLSVIAVDPDLPAQDYGGLENLKPIRVNLDRDLIATPVGILFKPLKAVDLTITYSPIVSGRNVAQAHTVSIGINVVSDINL